MNKYSNQFTFEERYMAFMLSTLHRMKTTSIYPLQYKDKISRSSVLGTALKYASERDGICLEFGVHSGASLALSASRLPDHHFFGFDSFEGFPDDGRPDWDKDFSTTPPSNLPKNCTLVKGWFNETLPEFLKSNDDPVAFINIDCDIYSSTATILSELERSSKIGPGSIINFDEIINYKTALWNESLALFELIDRTGWGVEWLCVHLHVRGLEESLDLLMSDQYPSWKSDTKNGYLVQAAARIVQDNQDLKILETPHIAKRVKELAAIFKKLTVDYNNGNLSQNYDGTNCIIKSVLNYNSNVTNSSFNRRTHDDQYNTKTQLPVSIQIGNSANRTVNEAGFSARTNPVYLGNDTLICRILGRYKFFVHGSDTGIAPHLLLDGVWEIWITEFVARNIAPGSKCIDIGANYGYYTVLMGSLTGKTGYVTAIEPNPAMTPFLERNILVNKLRAFVKIDSRAISDESEKHVHFYCPKSEPKNAKIVDNEVAKILNARGENIVKVKTLALNDLNHTDIGFIKVDVEGAEDKFWYGSKDFLYRNPNAIVLLEFNPRRVKYPKEVLDDIATIYPLRYLLPDGKLHHAKSDYLIDNCTGDWILVLSNSEIK